MIDFKIAYNTILEYDKKYLKKLLDDLSPDISYNNETTDIELPTPTRSGYVFTGWKLNESVGNWTANIYLGGSKHSYKYGNIRLVAQWARGSVKVTFNSNGGSVDTRYRYVSVGEKYGEYDNIYPEFGSDMTPSNLHELYQMYAAEEIEIEDRTKQLNEWNKEFSLNANSLIKYNATEDYYYFRSEARWKGGNIWGNFHTKKNGSIIPGETYTYVIEILSIGLSKGTTLNLSLGTTGDKDGGSQLSSASVKNIQNYIYETVDGVWKMKANPQMVFAFTRTASEANPQKWRN